MSAIVTAALAVLLLPVAALIRALHKDRRDTTAWQQRERQRTADDVLDDVRAWRAARDLDKCQAIWPDAPPFIPQQRKETGQ